ncbi:uncharacterized protein SETTUDRAFT_152556 [Exserohilum turcica Et28A]|uniref:Heterokaryon incompatibility domain-containing protein n=1 Tax=Exserohilum turcicum (strain 28A) TaxID=671987 RepID=R0KF31_EXST2|nr:uncharacterized protein SETTUDRAFT_152556 [Exserohilum turcica Et28A]EOA91458.1 hypothetical protein SETTUDRAFT_152556 [Exserohilum turcica Et28A]
MDRVVRFAQSVNITRLWVDRECIYQRPEDELEDKELGVQIMDVVYGDSAYSVGLLTVELLDQHEIDLLSDLLARSLFTDPRDTDTPQLQPGVDVTAVQILILRILSDSRWSRGWIFQEDHLASERMVLLVPCNEQLNKGSKYRFGKIPGELQIKLKDFRQTVTMFCLASADNQRRWPNSEMLEKVKQYNIYNKKIYAVSSASQGQHYIRSWDDDYNADAGVGKLNTQSGYSKIPSYPTTTTSVLEDINNRCLENESDRIAILANALKCTKRLNTRKGSPLVEPEAFSLSAALLTIILMNGEILANAPECQAGTLPSEADLMSHTLQSYLIACQFFFTPPSLKLHQSFIDRCRFISPTITRRGIETKGFLFNLLPDRQLENQEFESDLLHLTDADRDALSGIVPERRRWNRKLDNIACQALEILIEKLEKLWPGSKLASHMRRHIELDQNPPRSKDPYAYPSTPYVLDAMSALYQALRDDREICLARLASAPQDVEPVALFMRPEPHGWRTKLPLDSAAGQKQQMTKIFTSWDNGRHQYDKERLVSLEVGIWDAQGVRHDWDPQTCFMKSYGWVNGIWAVNGEQMEEYVFPLAGITKETDCGDTEKSSGGKKRKRRHDD